MFKKERKHVIIFNFAISVLRRIEFRRVLPPDSAVVIYGQRSIHFQTFFSDTHKHAATKLLSNVNTPIRDKKDVKRAPKEQIEDCD